MQEGGAASPYDKQWDYVQLPWQLPSGADTAVGILIRASCLP